MLTTQRHIQGRHIKAAEARDVWIAISWVGPRAGNDRADRLAKLRPERGDYKMQAYIAALHKRELLEAWWSNHPNPPSSGFQPANTLPPNPEPN